MPEKLKDINEIYGKTTHISEINKWNESTEINYFQEITNPVLFSITCNSMKKRLRYTLTRDIKPLVLETKNVELEDWQRLYDDVIDKAVKMHFLNILLLFLIPLMVPLMVYVVFIEGKVDKRIGIISSIKKFEEEFKEKGILIEPLYALNHIYADIVGIKLSLLDKSA